MEQLIGREGEAVQLKDESVAVWINERRWRSEETALLSNATKVSVLVGLVS